MNEPAALLGIVGALSVGVVSPFVMVARVAAGASRARGLAIETGWYALVAFVLSSPAPQRAYLACKTWVDRTAGVVMVGLGLKLATGAAH